jgi:hypothetical protein
MDPVHPLLCDMYVRERDESAAAQEQEKEVEVLCSLPPREPGQNRGRPG